MKKSTAKKIIAIGGSILLVFVMYCTYYVISAMPTAAEREYKAKDAAVLADDSYAIVEGCSMSPALETDDVIEIRKGTYPEYHDIVAFTYEDENFVKRVIGLPGDTIEIRAGDVYRNGIEEIFLSEIETTPFCMDGPIVVDEDCYFVLGDNRELSVDSRIIGVIPKSDVIGVAEKVEEY